MNLTTWLTTGLFAIAIVGPCAIAADRDSRRGPRWAAPGPAPNRDRREDADRDRRQAPDQDRSATASRPVDQREERATDGNRRNERRGGRDSDDSRSGHGGRHDDHHGGHHGWRHDDHHGGHRRGGHDHHGPRNRLGLFFHFDDDYPAYRGHRSWVAGYYVVETIQVCEEPGHYERRWVPAVYEDRCGPGGRRHRVLVCDGHYEEFWVPARYVTREVQRWVPGYWSVTAIPAPCPPPARFGVYGSFRF